MYALVAERTAIGVGITGVAPISVPKAGGAPRFNGLPVGLHVGEPQKVSGSRGNGLSICSGREIEAADGGVGNRGSGANPQFRRLTRDLGGIHSEAGREPGQIRTDRRARSGPQCG
jgi:hypothetical protein